MSRGVIYSGGLFQNVAGQYRPFFAVFPPSGSPTITNQPISQIISNGLPVTFAAGALLLQWFNADGFFEIPTLHQSSCKPSGERDFGPKKKKRF